MSIEGAGFDAARCQVHDRAIGRRENEGGSFTGLHQHRTPTVAGEIGDAEAGNLRVRLIALENLVVALLAGAPDSQSALVREMAAYISPRPGMTPHRGPCSTFVRRIVVWRTNLEVAPPSVL